MTHQSSFRTRSSRDLMLLLLSISFTLVGWWMADSEPVCGWLCVVIFGLTTPILLVAFVTGGTELRLDGDGFERGNVFGRKRYRWNEIEPLYIYRVRGGRFLAVKYLPGKGARTVMRDVFGEGVVIAAESKFGGTSYGIPLKELCNIMNSWRQEYGETAHTHSSARFSNTLKTPFRA